MIICSKYPIAREVLSIIRQALPAAMASAGVSVLPPASATTLLKSFLRYSSSKGVEAVLHRNENPVVATVILPALVTEEEEVAATEAAPAAGEVPTTEQGAKPEEGEGGEEKEKEKGK